MNKVNTCLYGMGMTSKPSSCSRKLIMGVSLASTTILFGVTEKMFIDSHRELWHITGCSCVVV